jgi:hypothetical protein
MGHHELRSRHSRLDFDRCGDRPAGEALVDDEHLGNELDGSRDDRGRVVDAADELEPRISSHGGRHGARALAALRDEHAEVVLGVGGALHVWEDGKPPANGLFFRLGEARTLDS